MKVSQGLGNLTEQSFANRTGCGLGLYRVMRKKQLGLGVNSTSLFIDLDLYIDKTDLKALLDQFVDSCFDKDNKLARLLRISRRLLDTVLPVYLGFGSLWNLLIIIYFLQTYRKKLLNLSSYHFIIVNIAFADLLVCLALTHNHSSLTSTGRFECLFLKDFGKWITPTASVWLLTLLSYARYRMVVKPFQRKMTKKKCTLFVIACWAVGFCTASYYSSHKEYSDSKGCEFTLPTRSWFIYHGLSYIFDSAITSSLMLYFYYKIKKKLLKNELELSRQTSSQKNNQTALKTLKYLLTIYATTACFGHLIYALALFVDRIVEETVFFYSEADIYLSLVRIIAAFFHIFKQCC